MLDGATRDGEGHRDLGIAQPVARELNHFVLARRELAAVSPSSGSVRRYEAALPECRPDAARVPLGAEVRHPGDRVASPPPPYGTDGSGKV